MDKNDISIIIAVAAIVITVVLGVAGILITVALVRTELSPDPPKGTI